MASPLVLTPDRFVIGLDNYAALPYQKNGIQKLGGYDTRGAYAWETVYKLDLSTIPAGSTIDSVTTDVNFISNSAASNVDLSIREQTEGIWNDNGSEPTRLLPTFFDTATTFVPILSTYTVILGSTLIQTIPTSASLVQVVQNWLDGVGPAENGLVLSFYTGYWGYTAEVDAIEVTIKYSGPTPPARRRIMIIS